MNDSNWQLRLGPNDGNAEILLIEVEGSIKIMQGNDKIYVCKSNIDTLCALLKSFKDQPDVNNN